MGNTKGMHELKFGETAVDFPQHIVSEILIRLPVKSLIKCTSVCKTWGSMIINTSFIRTHLRPPVRFANQNDIDLFLIHTVSNADMDDLTYSGRPKVVDQVYSLHYDNPTFDRYSNIEFPIAIQKPNIRVVSICDGLVCLGDDKLAYGCNYFIWNPAIRKLVTLPKPVVTHGAVCALVGFGFDALTNDYKVVRIFLASSEVYSLATGKWTSLGVGCPRVATGPMKSSVFLNGFVHWPVSSLPERDPFILAFDVSKDVFHKISVPNFIQKGLVSQLSLSDNRESIALFMSKDLGEHIFLDIWLMEQYGIDDTWTKLITLGRQGESTLMPKPLCFRKSGELLCHTDGFLRKEQISSVDLARKEFKTLGISATEHCTVHFYKESLLLLDKSDAESY